jgi:hypothetical protein
MLHPDPAFPFIQREILRGIESEFVVAVIRSRDGHFTAQTAFIAGTREKTAVEIVVAPAKTGKMSLALYFAPLSPSLTTLG